MNDGSVMNSSTALKLSVRALMVETTTWFVRNTRQFRQGNCLSRSTGNPDVRFVVWPMVSHFRACLNS